MRPDTLSKETVQSSLPDELIRWEVEYVPETTSTQDYAAKRFRKEGRGGLFVITNHQTSGRGREKREWKDVPGSSLMFSLTLHPGHAPSNLHLLTITAALAVCNGLRSLLDIEPEVKWPNDVLINGKKVCGILSEMIDSESGEKGIIMGIGINVNQKKEDLPETNNAPAGSVRMIVGKPVQRLLLLSSIMKSFEDLYFLYQKGDHEEIIRLWKNNSSMLGRHVSLRTGDREVHGTVTGLEDSGAIVLRLDTGPTRSFLGSECRFLDKGQGGQTL